jgi:hypothetical protein
VITFAPRVSALLGQRIKNRGHSHGKVEDTLQILHENYMTYIYIYIYIYIQENYMNTVERFHMVGKSVIARGFLKIQDEFLLTLFI